MESLNTAIIKNPSTEEQQSHSQVGVKRSYSETISQQLNTTFESTLIQNNEKKTTQGGRCRLFIGNVPSDITQEEFLNLFGKYGELVEYFVNPSRSFGFIKLVCFSTLFSYKATTVIFGFV